jgi:large subunit ribosomal protein L25
MAEIAITGKSRTEFGKGASRRDRRAGYVPAVIYGHGEKPVHLSLPARDLVAALKHSNVLLDISLDGKNELTLPKSVTKNPLTSQLEHIDLVLVRRGERVTIDIPVHTEGEHDRDGILEHVNNVIQVEAEATSIPEFLTLSIAGLKAGLSLYASDVPLPVGITLVSDPHTVVVHLSERSTPSEDAVATPAAEAAAPEAAKE